MLRLRPAVFHILLALASGERHGLGIADEVERASGGVVDLGPGTLYRSLAEMVADELVEFVRPHRQPADPRRKYYRLTAAGRAALKAETEQLQQIVGIARARKVVS